MWISYLWTVWFTLNVVAVFPVKGKVIQNNLNYSVMKVNVMQWYYVYHGVSLLCVLDYGEQLLET